MTGTQAAAAGAGTGMIILLFLLCMYFLPTVVAALRKHRQTGAIAALNILLGWTVLGWIGAFVWSLTSSTPQQTVIVQTAPGAVVHTNDPSPPI